MKNLIFAIAILFAGTTALTAQTAMNVNFVEVNEVAAFSFDKTVHDFKAIPQNKPVTAEFVITNNSDKPMLIMNVKTSCGCTVPAYEKAPIAPGESSVIKAVYNAKKVGKFTKPVTVTTNLSDEHTRLKIVGTVETVK